MPAWLKNFLNKVFVATMLWMCVGFVFIFIPAIAYSAGIIEAMPQYAQNIEMFYDRRLVIGILVGGAVLLAIAGLIWATIARLSKSNKSSKESSIKEFAIEAATQLLGVGCLLEVSSFMYWIDHVMGPPLIFRQSSNNGQVLTGGALIALAWFVHFLASEKQENGSAQI